MPGPSTRLILGSDLEYHRWLDDLTVRKENSIVSRRTAIEDRQPRQMAMGLGERDALEREAPAGQRASPMCSRGSGLVELPSMK